LSNNLYWGKKERLDRKLKNWRRKSIVKRKDRKKKRAQLSSSKS
jgi:hypothetical protein